MHLLNTPIGLSPVDKFVVKNIPANSKCGIIVNGGDGRLSQAIQKSMEGGCVIYNVEWRPELYRCVEGGEEKKSKDPWDVDRFAKIAAEHGGIDFIIFINLHEYWHGNLNSMQRILGYLKPEGLGFISFYNKNSMYEVRQAVPPFVAGFEQLSNPINQWAKMDLASWVIYLLDIGLIVNQIWGILEDEGFEYCRKNKKRKVTWEEKQLTVKVEDAGDAFIFGAPVMCIRFGLTKEGDIFNPKFFGIQYNASILQAILFPYLDVLPNEGDIFRAHLEVENRIEEGDEGVVLLNFFISQLDDFQDIRKVLVVGCNWGMDLLAIKKIKPNWDIRGIEGSEEMIGIGKDLMKSENITIAHYTSEGKFPFEDNAFDLVISLKYFSTIYDSLAKELAKEMVRVAQKGIAHFEDLRGPDFSMNLKLYSIPEIYKTLGYKAEVQFVRAGNKDTGLYILKVKK